MYALLAAHADNGTDHTPANAYEYDPQKDGQCRQQQPGGQNGQVGQQVPRLVTGMFYEVAHLIHNVLHRGGIRLSKRSEPKQHGLRSLLFTRIDTISSRQSIFKA